MKNLILCLGTILCVFSSSISKAQQHSFATTFTFEAKFADSSTTYNVDQTKPVSISLPIQMGWECIKTSTFEVENRIRAGFICSSDSWRTKMWNMVGCKKSEIDPSRASALRLFAPREDGKKQGDPSLGPDGSPNGKWVDLVVICVTVRL